MEKKGYSKERFQTGAVEESQMFHARPAWAAWVASAAVFIPAPALAVPIVIAEGPPVRFPAPNPPYSPEALVFQITFGYGDVSNTIGYGRWHSGPGIYDLSFDPGIGPFVSHATNGVTEQMTVTVRDLEGREQVFDRFDEAVAFLRFPDLHSLDVTGIGLEVIGVVQGAGTLSDAISARLLVYGVPEPGTGVFFIAGGLLLTWRRGG